MPCKIVYSPLAVKDLDEIWEHVASSTGSAGSAEAVVGAIQDRIDLLAAFPLSGTPIESLCNVAPGYRLASAKGYIAFYRHCAGKVFVDRILSERRDYLALLFQGKTVCDM